MNFKADIVREKKFEALSLRYTDHAELLKFLTTLDHGIVGDFLTIQLVFAAWISDKHVSDLLSQVGQSVIDIGIACCALWFLWANYDRRKEAVRTLKNITIAMGFEEKGFYLQDAKINADRVRTIYWFPMYTFAIFLSVLGTLLVVFSSSC